MEIIELDNKVYEAMVTVFGEKIAKYKIIDRNRETMTITLNDNVILKCYGFDGSVKIELGAKMFILEHANFWKIAI